MSYQHEAQLANVVTSYCACLGGIMSMIFTLLTRPHPRRWFFVYFCVLLTGIPTVWLHATGGDRVSSFFDVGSNIFLALSVLRSATRRGADPVPLVGRRRNCIG